MMKSPNHRLAILALLWMAWAQGADILQVAPSADAATPGASQVFTSLQAALNAARDGDTIRLAPGIYHERVKVKTPGITLTGPRDAIVDGSLDTPLQWERLPEYGDLAWRAQLPPAFFSHPWRQGAVSIACREGLLTLLCEERVTPGHPRYEHEHPGQKEYDKMHIFRHGVGKSGWRGVVGLAMCRPAKQDVVVAFGDGRRPAEAQMTVAPWAPVIEIFGDRCTVSGITIRHGWFAVQINGARDCVIDNCRILRSDFGVNICGRAKGCKVRHCEISMDAVSGDSPLLPGAWDVWTACKLAGYYDRIAVNINDTDGFHEIHDNYIHNHWGGVQDCRYREGKASTRPAGDSDLDIHHNRIDLIQDDGLEADGREVNCRWHDNYVTRCRCGFRIKNFLSGPLYAYHNFFSKNIEDFRNFVGEKNAIGYFYHNTSVTTYAIKNNKVPEYGVKGYHFLNNLFVCDSFFARTAGGKAVPDWQDHGNLYAISGKDRKWEKTLQDAQSKGFVHQSRFAVTAPGLSAVDKGDFALTAESPARQAGMSLKKYNLPGLRESEMSEHPDAGALPFGMPMPQIPRARPQ